MRAVDADELVSKLKSMYEDEESYTDKGWNLGIGAAIELIQAAMTVDTSVNLVKEHVTQMRDYYKHGVMCSLSESIQGEATCVEILKYIEELDKK